MKLAIPDETQIKKPTENAIELKEKPPLKEIEIFLKLAIPDQTLIKKPTEDTTELKEKPSMTETSVK